MTLASMNFLTKSELRRAVAQGMPVILFNTEHQVPAINGTHRVHGPWPRTAVPIEDVPVSRDKATACCRCDLRHTEDGKLVRQRQRIIPWHADVKVVDMRVVEVH